MRSAIKGARSIAIVVAVSWGTLAVAQRWTPAARLLFPDALTVMLSEPVAAAEGTQLLTQKLRPRPGVELMQATTDARVHVPANTNLFAARHGEAEIFCTAKMFRNQNLFGREQVCFEDQAGTGKFDVMRATIGAGPAVGEYESLDSVGRAEPIAPVAYRRLDPDEADTRELGVVIAKLDLRKRQAVLRAYVGGTAKTFRSPPVDLNALPATIEFATARFEFVAGPNGSYSARVINAVDPRGVALKTNVTMRMMVF